MKSLALYIDKWYIVGAISTDGFTRPVKLPNREDRVWLYFSEDIANNEISYGKGFQAKFRNNEVHYYGDVFSKITRSSEKYIKFKLPQPMKSIFKDSGIFNDFRKDIEEEKDITTYVSFSKDISLAARSLFINELMADGFDVKESVARIDHLALEYAAIKAGYDDAGYYLVMNACNENLHYSLYQRSDDLFLREREGYIFGLGTDVRSRALIEHVVDNINDKEHFLKTQDERESECLRMTQYVDEWLIKLSTARSFIPIQLTGITLSKDPYKDYSVTVQKAKIDERTKKIVTDIISVIVRFVKDNNISHDKIKGIILLGNTFTNSQFSAELSNYYNLRNNRMVCYKDTDLSSLVGAYDFIDCSQFSVERDSLRKNAETELRRIRLAEEEAEANLRAMEAEEQRAAEEQSKIEAERKFKDAMDKGYDAEKEHDYDEMAEYFGIALSLRPNDEEASRMHQDALRKKAELSVLRDNYKEKIQQAKEALDDKDYELAKQKAEEALSFDKESSTALRIKEEAVRHIKCAKELERYLDRADLFIAQKAYSEAKQELNKAKLLDVDDKEIKKREARIANEQRAVNQKVSDLSTALNKSLEEGRYEDALSACNELIEVDFVNSRKWSARIGDIRHKQQKAAEEEKMLQKLYCSIDSAQWSEDWKTLVMLCKETLAVREDPSIRQKLEKGEERLAAQKAIEELDSTIAEIKDLILSSDFDEARAKLNQLRKMTLAPSHQKKVKELNQLIFQKEDEVENPRRAKQRHNNQRDFKDFKTEPASEKPKEPRTVVTGFGNSKGKPVSNDDFGFEAPKKTHTSQSKSRPKPAPSTPKNGGDFFDSDFGGVSKTSSKSNAKPVGKITNDDFNF